MFHWFEHRQVYCPSRRMEASPADFGRAYEDVYLTASDGVRLHGWFLPAEPRSPRGRFVFLLFHGNTGNISHRLDFASAWLELGVNLFLFDYRGYGQSEGQPSELGTYLDAQAAYEWLRQRGFPASNIIALGKSLGGGIASQLAVREAVGGLILQSTFTSIPALARELFPWLPITLLNTIKYDTLSRLPQIRIPLLIVHSRQDLVVRYPHAQQNFAAANEPKMFWEIPGSHTSVLEAGRAHYLRGLQNFLNAHFDGG